MIKVFKPCPIVSPKTFENKISPSKFMTMFVLLNLGQVFSPLAKALRSILIFHVSNFFLPLFVIIKIIKKNSKINHNQDQSL
uniref:Uncharacterized protein n=1 Tax=Kalanchoe fedtschenkoi TaxID=63787 RepID=A0A7N0TR79_KALFE